MVLDSDEGGQTTEIAENGTIITTNSLFLLVIFVSGEH
jgi:hypothetical protein